MSRINPRFRAYGKARLDIARRAHTREDWAHLWKPTMHPFAFDWGTRWKHCIEYRVEDFPAEIGFFIDVLGFPVKAFNDQYAMFTSPDEAFHLAVLPADDQNPATPPDALRLQFMILNLADTVAELAQRGITFEAPPQPLHPGSHMHTAVFRTPHGLPVELWSEILPQPEIAPRTEHLAPPPEDMPEPAPPQRVTPQPESPPPKKTPAPPKRAPAPERILPSQPAPPPPQVRQPSRPVVAVRARSDNPLHRPPALRSNRVPPQFIPIPTRETHHRPPQPEQPADEYPVEEENILEDEPHYEDLDDLP
ncbi:MAG: hypothetical protein Fur0018_27430 [Anaerolineales bacterium]